MKRRSFLQTGSFLSLPILLNGLPVTALGRKNMFDSLNPDNDKVLVLIQLNGGNDGLNTIIPMEKYDLLSSVRSNILIPETNLVHIEDKWALHPNLESLKGLYDNGLMTVVQDVGYPNQNRSHFRSTDIWTSGSPADQFWTTGWLGRYFEQDHFAYPEGYPNSEYPDPFALSIGSNVSETCQGTITNFSLAITDPSSISPLAVGGEGDLPDTPYGRELDFLRTTIEQANAYGSQIQDAAEAGSNLSELYADDYSLTRQLRTIANLISGGLKTKVYIANLGGFDTHANQVGNLGPLTGDHADLMRHLAVSVEAFIDDLNKLGLSERVMTMTFSEFGRRIRSNNSLGTDHGTAAPLLFFGSCVNGGIIGDTPALPDQPGIQDGVPMQYDFRNLYGTILTDWFEIDETEVRSLLFSDFQRIPVFQDCKQTTSTDDPAFNDLQVINYPNPFATSTTIRIESSGGKTRVSIFDSIGHELKVLMDKKLPSGVHDIPVELGSVPAGNYFCRVITEREVKNIPMIKVNY